MVEPATKMPYFARVLLQCQLLLRGILHIWVKARALPDVTGEMGARGELPVCYVMADYALSSVLILDRVCEQHGLARPLLAIRGMEGSGMAIPNRRAYAVLKRMKGLLIRRPSTRRASDVLKHLVQACDANRDLDVLLVPVTVFVGRSPDKTTGLAKILFAENWEVAGRFRRLFSTLINGRDTLVQFSRPISLQELTREELGPARSLRKVSRLLRVHFRRVRGAVIGPDLSHRRTMVGSIIKTPSVRRAIEEKARRSGISEEKAERLARKYALEISADYSYRFIRIAAIAIAWFTGKVLRGVNVHHFERVQGQALDHEIIYVPCHRSHMDYLLLSWLLHERGYVPPHIAAGVNLNLPLIGPFLRGGGAFYLRRTFKSQKLYSAVFHEYVSAIIAQGVSIEYFIEGTRSRTGRLLHPKAGMLAMTVSGYLHAPVRPVVFLPVNLGYEQLMEGRAYTRELAGSKKRSEKLTDLFKVFGVLGNDYGEASVSFGQPIFLDRLLEKHDPEWRKSTADSAARPPWLAALISELGTEIMTGINRAAAINPVNLLASVLLATPKHSLGEKELLEQIGLYQDLLRDGPLGEEITVTGKSPSEILDYCSELGLLVRIPHELGSMVALDPMKSVELTYFRNNVMHLFALQSLIACCFLNQREIGTAQLETIAGAVYPFLKSELFLPYEGRDLGEAISRNLDLLTAKGLLSRSADGASVSRAPGGTQKAGQLDLLARCLLQTLERYYITIAILAKNGSGTLSRGKLEKLCILTAQRISRLYEFEAPEFYDRNLFRQFINGLKDLGILTNDPEGRLLFGERLDEISEHARFILRKEIRLLILRSAAHAATLEELPEGN
jgi:glycerol-3-phosphate O-acyltransferase